MVWVLLLMINDMPFVLHSYFIHKTKCLEAVRTNNLPRCNMCCQSFVDLFSIYFFNNLHPCKGYRFINNASHNNNRYF